ncbi:MAG TPA: cupredoxin domain-containing protein [Bacteriovoracaceae bacterium]|nr:cupredoxin domain-containing protein [Bacteriovoracaceae bacterium]
MKFIIWLSVLFISFSALAAKRSITMVNYETEGVKQWLPGTIIVKKGDDVEITLINTVPSGLHGFFIPDFNVKKEVQKGKKEVVSFKADKDGLFEMKCHLHPAHVGGQLLVQP